VIGPRGDFTGLVPPVVVACSGGRDSLALLALAVDASLSPVAVHVDHGLRPESGHEGVVVERAATRLGAAFRAERVAVAAGPNLEARARTARYAALERARRELDATAVLTGHTSDDQAETVLLNILRGAATDGLAGIASRRGTLARPLLGIRRADTHAICRAADLTALDDPMNADPAYRRVFLRREVLPMLERAACRDLVPVLARQAEVLRAESDLLDDLAVGALDDAGGPEPRATAVAALPLALGRRAVRMWLGDPAPSFDEVERVLGVARGSARATELTGARRVERSRGVLRLGVHASALGSVRVPLPGTATGLGMRVESWVERAAPLRWPDGRWTCVLDAEAAGDVARLIPLASGAGVLARGDGTELWRVGYGVGASARICPGTRRFLWVTAQVDCPEAEIREAEIREAGAAEVRVAEIATQYVTGELA
jgi:tRNA(Ile)-lysidine synthase